MGTCICGGKLVQSDDDNYLDICEDCGRVYCGSELLYVPDEE